jgi:hypothetical protein
VLSRQHAEVWFRAKGSFISLLSQLCVFFVLFSWCRPSCQSLAPSAAPPLLSRAPARISAKPLPLQTYIKDVKSSNVTFINGKRLSSEGHENKPFELKSAVIVVRNSPRFDYGAYVFERYLN